MSLQTIPNEILYHIFDYLDLENLLFSLRYVCQRFYSLVHTYDKYHWNFQSISKTTFHLIYRLISFEQVIALTLSNHDQTYGQIELFFSLFNLEQFTRLQSLTLLKIDDTQLNKIFNSTRCLTLKSLSIDSKIFFFKKNTFVQMLPTIIEQQKLEKLDLDMWLNEINELQWPKNCTITHLQIRNSLSLYQFDLILQQSSFLKTIIVQDFNIDEIFSQQRQYIQLKSLTCKDGRIQMNKIEQVLRLIPAIEELKLIGNGNLFDSSFDGNRWENFIKTNLLQLKKFQCFISVLTPVNFDVEILKQLIEFFRTPFWIEEKRCLIQYDYIIYLHELILYSLPICQHSFDYHTKMNKISVSNFKQENEQSNMMDQINRLELNLTQIMNDDDISERNQFIHPLFRNVRELKLNINGVWPKRSLRFLSTTIDLFRITKLSLSVNFLYEYMPSVASGTKKLLEYAENIQTLTVTDMWGPNHCTTTMEIILEMLTSNIKQLEIRIKNSDDIKFIVENVGHLHSVNFLFSLCLRLTRDELVERLSDVSRQFSIWYCQHAVCMWFDHH